MSNKRTGFIFDERYLDHDTGVQTAVVMRGGLFHLGPEPHPSSVYITQRIKQFLDGSGLTEKMKRVTTRAADEEELAVYHTHEFIAGVRKHIDGGPSRVIGVR